MNIGDYVRSKSGGIGKIIKIDDDKIITDNKTFGLGWDGERVDWDFRSEIVKSSPNIIDLIGKFDYVNGFYVINKPSKLFNRIIHTEFDYFCEEDIETIVTKEQFESMKYEVKQ